VSRLHRPKAGFWIRLCVAVLYPLDGLLFRIRWRNLDRIPAPDQGGVIIAINHISTVDTVLMARLVWQSGRVPRFLVKSGVFSKPGLGQVMRGAKQIPVYRGTADAAESLREAVAALEGGEAVVIYPEGTISKEPNHWPMQGRTGIARLVLACPDIPVVPVGQWGAHPGRGISHLVTRRVSAVNVGEPLDLSRFRGKEPSARVLREITDEIMSAIRDEVAALRGETPPAEFYRPPSKRVDKATA
jgi:1-acyl-sn-glycerol-3-phosphate acyltransferase